MRLRSFLCLTLLASPALAEPVDNCATLLGSISVELRVARNLAPSTPTTFRCPRDRDSLLGASRQRILNSLGPPDSTDGASGEIRWSYYFSGTGGERQSGVPVLIFQFDQQQQQVALVDCQRSP